MNPDTIADIISHTVKHLPKVLTAIDEIRGLWKGAEAKELKDVVQEMHDRLSRLSTLSDMHFNTLRYVENCNELVSEVDKSKEILYVAVVPLLREPVFDVDDTGGPSAADLERRREELRGTISNQLQRALGAMNATQPQLTNLLGLSGASEFIAHHAKARQSDITSWVESVNLQHQAVRGQLAKWEDALSRRDMAVGRRPVPREIQMTAVTMIGMYEPILLPLARLQSVLLASVTNEFSSLRML